MCACNISLTKQYIREGEIFTLFQTVRSTQWVGTQYAKILLYRTQTSNFTIKRFSFHHDTQQTWQTNSNKYKMFARSLRSRCLGSFQHLEVKHCFVGVRKLGNLTRKHIKANVCKNYCKCACNILSFYFLYLNGNAKKWLVLLLNSTQYARPKKTTVRSAHGGRGCNLH